MLDGMGDTGNVPIILKAADACGEADSCQIGTGVGYEGSFEVIGEEYHSI